MAEIFLARRRGADAGQELVVIKRVLPHLAEDARFVAMFRDEARLAARIEHVNACRVLELGSVGDTYFIAMEYLHGVPLSRVLLRSARTHEQLDVRFIAGVIIQSCAGLHDAHELTAHDGRPLDVVHRDVSPPNIFVTAEGMVKLLDFGVAKARGASQKTRTGTVKGKNAYMSPEQVLGEEIDRRSDLFSLGIVMWESLTAARLFLRDTDFDTFRSITRGDIPDVLAQRPDPPPPVAADELARALEEAVSAIGGPATPDEIARYVHAHFSKELAAKQTLLEAAAAPDGAQLPRVESLDLGDDAGPPEVEDDEVTTAMPPRPPAVSGEIAELDRSRSATVPISPGVARLDTAAEPNETAALIEPPERRSGAIARQSTPAWLPGFALLCAGVFGLAALIYWLL
jgi:serine/threonine protein kinase